MIIRISLLLFVIGYWTCSFSQSSTISLEELRSVQSSKRNLSVIAIGKVEDFEENNIPGAVRIWRPDYEDSQAEYSGMMAPRDSIAKLLGYLGVKSTDLIVLYDYKGGCDAARFWWILNVYGHKNASILNLDINELGVAPDLETEPLFFVPTEYEFPEPVDSTLFTDLGGLKKAKSRNAKILDVRTAPEFTGEMMKDGAFRKGHIPGSLFCPWTEAINAKGDKKLRSKKELDSIYTHLGLYPDDEIIVYCQSGVRSAHTTYVLTEILGYRNVKNYDGSWIEYSFNKDLPIETGGLEERTQIMPLSKSFIFIPLIIVMFAIGIALRRRINRSRNQST